MRSVQTWLLVSSFLLASLSFAQYPETSLNISASLSIPTGDYAETIGENPKLTRRAGFYLGDGIGLAKPGFGIGADLITPTGIPGLGWILNATYVNNGTETSDIMTEFNKQLGDTANVSFDMGNWMNIPVMTGIRYQYPIFQSTYIFASLQGGINITRAPYFKATVNGVLAENTSYQTTVDFGFGISLGVILLQDWTLEVQYLQLDTPTYKGERILSESVFPEIVVRKSTITGEDKRISMLLITLGYNIL